MSEPLEQYSRVNDQLLDGCEAAYTAIADEFHSASPDWNALVDAGAIDAALATHLEEARGKWAAAGRRPMLETGRVNAQVLLVDATNPDAGFIATVVFRSREQRSWVSLDAASATSDAAGRDEAAAATESGAAASGATPAGADAAPADVPSAAPPSGETDGAATAADGDGDVAATSSTSEPTAEVGFEDTIQLWTFSAEQPELFPYINWLRSTITSRPDYEAEDVEVPVRWKLRDINFVIHGYEPPAGPTDPAEAVNELLTRAMLAAALATITCYTLYKLASRDTQRGIERRAGHEPGARLLGGVNRTAGGGLAAPGSSGSSFGVGGAAGGGYPAQRREPASVAPTWTGSAPPREPRRAAASRNQWGDETGGEPSDGA